MQGTKIETLYVEWRADYDKFKAEMQQVKTELTAAKTVAATSSTAVAGMGSAVKSAFASALGPIALATAALQAVKMAANELRDAVKLAMDVTESENLFNTSLGNMADATRAWSKELAAAIGVNDFEIRRVSGLWFTMAQSMGLADDQALAMSKNLVQLKYDLMSFYNLGGDQADTIIKGMISGETEPAKQIGVILTEAMAKQALYRAGVVAEGQEIDATTMMYGRYLAMMEQTVNAHGDMARTIDSPANALRVFQATLMDIKLALGEAFLPIFQIAIPALQTLANVTRAVAEMISDAIGSGGRAGLSVKVGDVSSAAKAGANTWSEYGNKATTALNNTASGLSKLRGIILGFDELNVMQDTETAAAGAAGGLGAGGLLGEDTGLQIPGIPEIEIPATDTTELDNLKNSVADAVEFISDKWLRLRSIFLANPLTAPLVAAVDGFKVALALFGDSIPQYDFLPDDLSEKTKEKLEPFMRLWNDTQTSLKQWSWGNQTITWEMANGMVAAVESMKSQLIAAIDEQNAESLRVMTEFFNESDALTEEQEAEALRQLSKDNADRKTQITQYTQEINRIYQDAAEEHRALTDEENRKVAALQDKMKETAIETMSESSDEQQKILKHLQENASDISARQAADIVANSLEAKEATINDAIDRADEIIANADRMREAGAIDEETYQTIIDAAKQQKDDTIAAAETSHKKVVEEARKQAVDHVNEVNWETGEIKTRMQVMVDDFKNKTAEIKAAVDAWTKPFRDWKNNVLDIFYELSRVHISLSGVEHGGSGRSIPQYADGGLPALGELFVAREAGPEMVGTIGGRSAVVNNTQIVEAIRMAVADAMSAALGDRGDSETVINLYVDDVLESVTRRAARNNLRSNRVRIPVGG